MNESYSGLPGLWVHFGRTYGKKWRMLDSQGVNWHSSKTSLPACEWYRPKEQIQKLGKCLYHTTGLMVEPYIPKQCSMYLSKGCQWLNTTFQNPGQNVSAHAYGSWEWAGSSRDQTQTPKAWNPIVHPISWTKILSPVNCMACSFPLSKLCSNVTFLCGLPWLPYTNTTLPTPTPTPFHPHDWPTQHLISLLWLIFFTNWFCDCSYHIYTYVFTQLSCLLSFPTRIKSFKTKGLLSGVFTAVCPVAIN